MKRSAVQSLPPQLVFSVQNNNTQNNEQNGLYFDDLYKDTQHNNTRHNHLMSFIASFIMLCLCPL